MLIAAKPGYLTLKRNSRTILKPEALGNTVKTPTNMSLSKVYSLIEALNKKQGILQSFLENEKNVPMSKSSHARRQSMKDVGSFGRTTNASTTFREKSQTGRNSISNTSFMCTTVRGTMLYIIFYTEINQK